MTCPRNRFPQLINMARHQTLFMQQRSTHLLQVAENAQEERVVKSNTYQNNGNAHDNGARCNISEAQHDVQMH